MSIKFAGYTATIKTLDIQKMPSFLVSLTNEATQKANDGLLPFPIRWNKRSHRWEYKKKNEFRYYTANYLFIFGWLALDSLLLLIHFINPGLFKPQHVIIILLQMTIALASLFFLLLTKTKSSHILNALNMNCAIEDDPWFLSEGARKKFSRNPTKCMPKSVENLVKLTEDKVGVVVFLYFISMTVLLPLAALFILFKEWDPLHLLFRACGQLSLISILPLKAARWCICFYVFNTCMIILRYSFTFYLYTGMSTYLIISDLTKVRPNLSKDCLNFYRQLEIQQNEYREPLVLVSTGVLSSCFVILVLGPNTALVAMFLGEVILALCISVLSIALCFCLQICFFFCCHIFESSSALLQFWSFKAGCRKDGGYMKRVARALGFLFVPAGEVGKFDREIKMNYFNQVVDGFTGVLMICSETYFYN